MSPSDPQGANTPGSAVLEEPSPVEPPPPGGRGENTPAPDRPPARRRDASAPRRRWRLLHPLDRYVFQEWTRIFVTTAVGFPLLVIVIDLVDNLDKYLNRNLPRADIALSYLYWFPESMFMALPAAVLFATVFTIGALTRHSEITAAKASGISFHRVARPIFVGALLAAGLTWWIGELLPITNKRRQELLETKKFDTRSERYNFAFAAEHGRVYKVSGLHSQRGLMDEVEIERRGRGPAYPSYILTAQEGQYDARHGWTLRKGHFHILPDRSDDIVFSFDSLNDRRLTEPPAELLTAPRDPHDMGYRELSRFIAALERSGGDASELRVERALKIAVPVTCLIIALFGAPLATSTQRGGAAYGVALSLGTTVVFLVLIQLTKAIGGHGAVPPDLAAWFPNALFGLIGVFLLARART